MHNANKLNEHSKYHALIQCVNLVNVYMKDKHNLTTNQYNTLVCLITSLDTVQDSFIIDYLNIAPSSLIAITSHLINEGLILRHKGGSYTITTKGRFILDDIIKYFALLLNT